MHPIIRKPLNFILMLMCTVCAAVALMSLVAGIGMLFGTLYALGAMMQGLWVISIGLIFTCLSVASYWGARATDGHFGEKLFEAPFDIRRVSSWKFSLLVISFLFAAGFAWHILSF
jgi:hypothetical protein